MLEIYTEIDRTIDQKKTKYFRFDSSFLKGNGNFAFWDLIKFDDVVNYHQLEKFRDFSKLMDARVYTVRENQGKTYLFQDGQGKSGKVREFNEKVREKLEKVREIFLESSYLL